MLSVLTRTTIKSTNRDKREPSNSVEVAVIITGYVYGVMVCILTKLIRMYFLMCTILISFLFQECIKSSKYQEKTLEKTIIIKNIK